MAEIIGERRAVAEGPGLGIFLVGDAALRATLGILVVIIFAGDLAERFHDGRVGAAEALGEIGFDVLQRSGAAGLDGGELAVGDVHRAAGIAHRALVRVAGPTVAGVGGGSVRAAGAGDEGER